MRRNTEQIEIQEPALQEITHKRSCVRQSCTSGCGCIFIFLLISFLFLWFVIIPRPEIKNRLPATFPKTIPIYDIENIESVTIRTQQDLDPRLTSLAVIPQMILAPIVSFFDEKIVQPHLPGVRENRQFSNWVALVDLLEQPNMSREDTYIVHWLSLDAEPSFIKEYYQKRLLANGFSVNENNTVILFEQENLSGTIDIRDVSPRPGTDEILLTVYLGRS